jgi:hypothetical protein
MKTNPSEVLQTGKERRNEMMIQRWHKMQEMGKGRYVLLYGVLGFGGSMSLLGILVLRIENGDWLPPLQFVGLLGASILLGSVDGFCRWWIFERKCSQLLLTSHSR